MDADTRLKTEEKIIAMLKTVYDPEIPVTELQSLLLQRPEYFTEFNHCVSHCLSQ